MTPSALRWFPLAAALALVPVATPAFADCQEEMGKIMAERQTLINSLNKLSGGGKQLEPMAACPKLRGLAAADGKLVSYLEKNKDWCNIPDNFVDNAKAGRDKSATFAAKACKVAAQVEKMKQQQAAGGGNAMGGPQVQRLPAGPL